MSSLWNQTNDQLIKLAEKYEIPCDPENLNRKELIPMLINAQAQAGDLTQPAAHDDDGNEIKEDPEEETFVVLFHQREGQPNYVFLGHNGCGHYLPCDVKWRLPIRFKAVLDDAKLIKVVPNVDSQGRTKGVKTYKVPALNYTIFPE
jgi:hypothetical protein